MDEFQWLEDIEDAKALEWVKTHNHNLFAKSDPEFLQMHRELLKINNSKDKIPYVKKGPDNYYYNLWTDETYNLGLWRRCTFEEYLKTDIQWETVLDVDELSRCENKTWVWHGAKFLETPIENSYHCLINLSRGGSDADETREFNLTQKKWVTVEEGGFFRAEAKGDLTWKDANTVYVYTDFGNSGNNNCSDNDSMTDSGYPRIVKEWTRSGDIRTIYEGEKTDMYIGASYNSSCQRSFVTRVLAFYNDSVSLINADNSLTWLQLPNTANKEIVNNLLFLELRESWNSFKKGALVVTNLDLFLENGENTKWTCLFEPTETTALSGYSVMKDYVLLNILDNVKSSLCLYRCGKTDNDVFWYLKDFPISLGLSDVTVIPIDSEKSNSFFLTVTDFLTPSTLSYVDLDLNETKLLKSLPHFFDSSDSIVEQFYALSDDKTQIPYFIVRPKSMPMDSNNPVLLYGYGGFEISILPNYSAGVGLCWLNHTFKSKNEDRKGVFVVANIRGGGEYGPSWHQAALKEKRHKAYEDFSSVAKDLIQRKITQPMLLACQGGSNGGLLTGNMLVKYPELFGAIVIQVPLLDMKRYNKLLAGASWMAEYGDPDKEEEWKFLKKNSPYHLLQENPEMCLPPTLILTSTRDDRVHPGHARKMVALMHKLGKDITYYENIEGGHGGAANADQRAHMAALMYTFLQSQMQSNL